MINKTKENTISIIELTMKSDVSFHKALESVKQSDYERAQFYLNEGNTLLLQASQMHTLLLKESETIDLLTVHAEDMLISVQLYKSLMKELIEYYKKNKISYP